MIVTPERIKEIKKTRERKRFILKTITDSAKTHYDEKDKLSCLEHTGKFDSEYTRSGETYLVGKPAERQIFTKLHIPTHYLRRCPPNLKARNINYWISQYPNKKILLRSVKENDSKFIRAVLSPSYVKLDNISIVPLLIETLQEKAERGILEDLYFSNFETDWYFTSISCTYRSLVSKLDDAIYWAGVSFTNSETGGGAVWIKPLIQIGYTSTASSFSLLDSSPVGSTRFIHKREIKKKEIKEAIEKAIEVSQVGVIRAMTLSEEEVEPALEIEKISQIPAIPRRLISMIRGEFIQQENVRRLRLIKRILEATQGLPAVQKHIIQTKIGRHLDLFRDIPERVRLITEDII